MRLADADVATCRYSLAAERGDRRIELVRDAGDELAHRRHLLGLNEPRLGLLQLLERFRKLHVAHPL